MDEYITLYWHQSAANAFLGNLKIDMLQFKLALAILCIYLTSECVVAETSTTSPTPSTSPWGLFSSTTTWAPFSSTTPSEVNATTMSGTTPETSTGSGGGGNSAYLVCLMHFHQYYRKNEKYISDLRDRVKCHEDWIKHQEVRIKDLETINNNLRYENDHLQHVIYILHLHYNHLWHHYKDLRKINKHCRNRLASC